MAGSAIQILQNDLSMKISWLSDKTGAYIGWNLYWSTDSAMAGEALIASNISNVTDISFSKNDVIYTFDRANLGLTVSSEFYARLKGVNSAGVEDIVNPGPIKFLKASIPPDRIYSPSQLYGWNEEKSKWVRISVEDDGSLSARV